MAPKGYQVAQDIHFSVKSTGEIQHVVMKDELKEGTIRTNLPDNFRDGSNTNGGIRQEIMHLWESYLPKWELHLRESSA